jgi:hypothetical protein
MDPGPAERSVVKKLAVRVTDSSPVGVTLVVVVPELPEDD